MKILMINGSPHPRGGVPSRVMRKFVCKLWLNEVSQQ